MHSPRHRMGVVSEIGVIESKPGRGQSGQSGRRSHEGVQNFGDKGVTISGRSEKVEVPGSDSWG